MHDDGEMGWLEELLSVFAEISGLEFKRRKFGKNHYENGGALVLDGATFAEINWGGAHQNSTLQVMIKGQGCSMICEWTQIVSRLLELEVCRLTRVDVALDVFDGSLTLEDVWAQRDDRRMWTRSKGGRPPKFLPIGDMTERGPYGRTIYIGTRDSDLFGRVYEKGMQIFSSLANSGTAGDLRSTSVALAKNGPTFLCGDYVRFEAEFKAKTTILPIPILLSPDALLAGAYPFCEKFLVTATPYMRLRQEHLVMTEITAILKQIKKQYGPSIYSAIEKFGQQETLKRITSGHANKALTEKGVNLAQVKNTPHAVQIYLDQTTLPMENANDHLHR